MKYQPDNARCYVYIYREGMLSSVGHDLKLEIEPFRLEIADDGDRVSATFRMDRFAVLGSVEGGRVREDKLSDSDKRDIRKNMDKVLDPGRHPEARFASTSVERRDGRVAVKGDLTLKGNTRTIAFEVVEGSGDARTKVRLHQPDYGIKPFKALFGGLRVKPEVDVEIIVPLAGER